MLLQKTKEIAYKTIVLILFIGLNTYCFYAFINALFSTLTSLNSEGDFVIFNKGAFYLFGVSIGLFALIAIMVYQGVLKKTLTTKVTRLFSQCAATSLILTFTFPILSHLYINHWTQNNTFFLCNEKSNVWFHMAELVYVNDTINCLHSEYRKSQPSK